MGSSGILLMYSTGRFSVYIFTSGNINFQKSYLHHDVCQKFQVYSFGSLVPSVISCFGLIQRFPRWYMLNSICR